MNRPALASIIAMACLAACAAKSRSGPPEIRYGRDECAECGMIVSEEKHAAATLVRLADELEPRFFDDIGDMLDYERKNPDPPTSERWVHDLETRSWARAESCWFVMSEQIKTPMSSGIGAFTDRARAEQAAVRHAGKLFDFAALGPARAQWMAERYK